MAVQARFPKIKQRMALNFIAHVAPLAPVPFGRCRNPKKANSRQVSSRDSPEQGYHCLGYTHAALHCHLSPWKGCSQKTRNYLGTAGMHLLRNQAFIFLQPAGLNHVLSLLSATKSQFQRNAYPVCNYASENGDRNTTTPHLCWGAEVPPVFRQTSPFPCHKPVPAQSPWVAPPESPGVGHNLLPQAAPIGMTNTLASEQTAP